MWIPSCFYLNNLLENFPQNFLHGCMVSGGGILVCGYAHVHIGVYAHSRACVHMCAHVWGCTHASLWRPMSGVFLSPSNLISRDRVSSLNPELTNSKRLASHWPASLCLPEMAGVHYMISFLQVNRMAASCKWSSLERGQHWGSNAGQGLPLTGQPLHQS